MATFGYNFSSQQDTAAKQHAESYNVLYNDLVAAVVAMKPPLEVIAEPEVKTPKSDWVLMPPEATRKMLEAFFGHHRFDDSWFYAYRQMVQEAQKQRGNLK